MSEPTLIQTKTTLPVADIRADDRLRPVSEAGVSAILASVEELGQIVTPLVVRQKHRSGGIIYELLDGAHRLEAARLMNMEAVPVRVFECGDDQARLLEIDGNLAGAELNALDTAVFLATRKAVYERLHPEARRGVAGAMHKNCATDMMSVAGFVKATAEKFGKTERHIYRMTAAGARLGPDEVAKLRRAPRAVTLKDLQEISKIGNSAERYDVVDLLSEGLAKSAAEARKKYAAAQPDYRGPAPVDPVDAEYLAMMNAFRRARKEARRRFVEDMFEDLAQLVTEASDAMLEARRGDAAAEEAA